MAWNPSKRPTAERALQYPFFAKNQPGMQMFQEIPEQPPPSSGGLDTATAAASVATAAPYKSSFSKGFDAKDISEDLDEALQTHLKLAANKRSGDDADEFPDLS